MSSITTKNGDAGMTNLIESKKVSKTDLRIEAVGSVDELTSHLGVIKAQTAFAAVQTTLTKIQENLVMVMAGIAEPHNQKHLLPAAAPDELEAAADALQAAFTLPKGWALPGGNPAAAEIDVARTVARRCERCLVAVKLRFGLAAVSLQYLNRLSDYLFILARYTEVKSVKEPVNSQVVTEVIKQLGQVQKLNLAVAKQLIAKIEAEAKSENRQVVIALTGPEGNPIAVHVMDGAYLVSFEAALKKAYTAAAVKTSTLTLARQIKPGETFQYLDQSMGEKLIFIGGGVPLLKDGRLLGALGISGGTGEEDDALAVRGAELFAAL